MKSSLSKVLMASLVLMLACLAQAAVAQNPADALSATPPQPDKPVKINDPGDEPDRGTQNPAEALSATPPQAAPDKPQKITDPKRLGDMLGALQSNKRGFGGMWNESDRVR